MPQFNYKIKGISRTRLLASINFVFSPPSRRSSVDPDLPSIITDPSVVLSPSEIDPSDLDDVSSYFLERESGRE